MHRTSRLSASLGSVAHAFPSTQAGLLTVPRPNQGRLNATVATIPTTPSGIRNRNHQKAEKVITSTQLDFPCIVKNEQRELNLQQQLASRGTNPIPQSQPEEASEKESGPEPAYGRIVSGYNLFHHEARFKFVHGGVIPSFEVAYETWGKLNEKKDNAILLFTGLSASSHAKSHEKNTAPGWWESFIGPGGPLDTDKFFVICANVMGGCYGSTGPSSVDPTRDDGARYGTRFPIVTIFDMVRAQFKLVEGLGIEKLYAAVGSSMGGMLSLAAGAMYPEKIGRVISISAAARSHPYSIALRYTQRQALMSDPNWNRGFYYDSIPPHVGMKLARQIATISYRSGPEWEQRFGRKRAGEDDGDGSVGGPLFCADFSIEKYLDHQGEKFCLQYDANSLLYISKAMDLFDMSHPIPSDPDLESNSDEQAALPPSDAKCNATTLGHEPQSRSQNVAGNVSALVQGLSPANMPVLVLGVQSDILFPIWQQKEIADSLRAGGNKAVTYYELDALYGHDTFLIDRVNVGGAIKGHLENVVP
ncbi:homoserine O-acetyltransferase [Cladochytrium replicatum]|nr:homoserine O-acetyltransferase [Cladochytrium replicatum]